MCKEVDFIKEVGELKNVCKQLMQTPHYAKLTEPGIFAIVSKAKAVGVDPMVALDGGMYYVKGKVEMSAQMMNSLIRQAKHSITKDKRSDDNICILHGKRADNGDTWTESFSIEEAQKAGLLGNMVWKIYPRDMLFARALSRLARQLFPDILRGCYVEGEISQETAISEELPIQETKTEVINSEQLEELGTLLNQLPKYKASVVSFLIKQKINLTEIPLEMYEKIVQKANQLLKEGQNEEELQGTEDSGDLISS